MDYFQIVGSHARGDLNAKDQDIITTIDLDTLENNLDELLEDIKPTDKLNISRKGNKFMQIIINDKKMDIWKVIPREIPYVKLMRTLNKKDATALYSIAKRKGIKIRKNGLYKDGRKIRIDKPITDEKIIRKISKSFMIPKYLR